MRLIRLAAACAVVTAMMCSWLAAPSWADNTISVQLTPSNIAIGGAQTTATITDGDQSATVSDIGVTASDPNDSVGPVTQNQDGTYSATITTSNSSTPGSVTITASDSANTTSAQATLIQHGAAASVGVQFSPTSTITANGQSTTNVTATVEDAEGDAVPGDTVSFSSNPTGNQFGTVTDNGDGTYTTTVVSTTLAGTPTITATDGSASGQATLNQVPGPATSVSVVLSRPSIVANGASTSTSTATATVTDAYGNAVSGDNVVFSSSDRGDHVVQNTLSGNGTYTATITSSTRAGTPTITATDENTGASGQCTLTQTAGPATTVSVSLSPTSIAADGQSTSTATATVTDAYGNPVPGDTVNFASDPGSPTGIDNGNGTYTATITSTTIAGVRTITATDNSVSPNVSSAPATLTQIAASRTILAPAATSIVSNQAVGLLAVVSAASGQVSGAVTFENFGQPITGCANVLISGVTLSASCSASFGAGTPQLSAVFTPDSASNVAGSTGTATLAVTRGLTSTSLRLSSPTVTVGTNETYLAIVAPANAGSLAPTGSLSFLDGGKPIAGCQGVPIQNAGGSAVATCTTAYTASGSHAISAVYNGDANFTGSSSGATTVPVSFLGTLAAALRWSFVTRTSYTNVLSLTVTGASGGSAIVVTCHGGGCPFASRRLPVANPKSCAGKSACTATASVALTPRFAKHRLRPGTKITVDIVRPGWIGKTYTFTIRAGHSPRTAQQPDPTNFILP